MLETDGQVTLSKDDSAWQKDRRRVLDQFLHAHHYFRSETGNGCALIRARKVRAPEALRWHGPRTDYVDTHRRCG